MGRRWLARFSSVFGHERAERELERELAAHRALIEEDLVRRSIPPEQARREACQAFGAIEEMKDRHRAERSYPWLEDTLRDLRYACRGLAKSPGFALVAVLTLTLGIGVNATLFSAYNAVALKPLPVADPHQVVRLERWYESGSRGDSQFAFSFPEYAYARQHSRAFQGLVAASWPQPVMVETGVEGNARHAEKAAAQLVAANYFADLGIRTHAGRTFLANEDHVPGANAVAVISYPFWQRRFHADPHAVGQVVKLNGTAFTVIGIAPEAFTGTSTVPQVPDLWALLSMQAQLAPGRDWFHSPGDLELQLLARIKASTTFQSAQAEADLLMRQFGSTYRQRDQTRAITLEHTAAFGNTEDIRFKALVTALMLLVGSVLLVACANLVNMLLARGAARQKEIGLRLALGAGRARIIRQLLMESLLLAMLGGLGGLLVSVWTTRLLWVSIAQLLAGSFGQNLVLTLNLTPDIRVMGYAFAVAAITGVLFGLTPALQFSRPDLTTALKNEGACWGLKWGRSRMRAALVAMQVAVSMVLLISTGLLLRGLVRDGGADPGFETNKVLMVSGDFGNDPAKGAALERRLAERLRNLPGVRSETLGDIPLTGTWTPPIAVEQARGAQGESEGRTLASYASDGYFETMGIAILRGRGFTEREAASAARVAVISESTARRYWPGEDPLGRQFKLDMYFRGQFTTFEVVGIARDVRFANLTRIDPAHVYLPTSAQDLYGLLLRAEGDPQSAVASVRTAVEGLDRNLLPGLSTITIADGPLRVQKALARTYAMYAGILALLALTLAGIGIYGLMAYLVNQRVAEIGVRMALGATAADVLRAIVLQGLRPAFAGLVLGMGGAAGLSWTLHTTLVFPGSADFFHGVPFYDPVTFLGLAGFLLLVAGLAALVPARQALRVDPMVALR